MAEVTIYELPPGYRFDVKFDNNYQVGAYQVSINTTEHIEHNLNYNKNSSFTYDDFSKFISRTPAISSMRGLGSSAYEMTFVIFNRNILAGTPEAENFNEGWFCISVRNVNGELKPELFEKFCKDHFLPHPKIIFRGVHPDAKAFFTGMSQSSALSKTGKVFGLLIRGNSDNYRQEFIADKTNTTVDTTAEAEKLLSEFVRMKSSSTYLVEVLKKTSTPLSNVSRIYNALENAIVTDFEFNAYRDRIMKYESREWINSNLRRHIKLNFKPIISQMKHI